MVLGQLLYHRMGAAAWYVLKKCGLTDRVNREFRHTLRMAYDSGRQSARRFRGMLAETADILNGADFPYAVLKGARLVYDYPDGLRTSHDLDILVGQQDIENLSNRLKAAGYRQGFIRGSGFVPATRKEILTSRLTRGETVPFIKSVGEESENFQEIDVNFSLDFQAKQSSPSVKLLLEEIRPMEAGDGRSLMTLSGIDFLIHLCAHLYKEATVYPWVKMGRDLSLYKFSDLYLLLTKEGDELFMEKLIRRIRACSAEKECYFALLLTSELFDMDNPCLSSLLETIRPADTGYMREVWDPAERRTYHYDIAFIDWLFCGDRCARLQ